MERFMVRARAGIPRFGVVPPKKSTTPKKKIRAGARKKTHTHTPQKHKNTPKNAKTPLKKHKKQPQKAGKNTHFFSRLRAKKKSPLPKSIGFAGTPKPPATPGIPALVRAAAKRD